MPFTNRDTGDQNYTLDEVCEIITDCLDQGRKEGWIAAAAIFVGGTVGLVVGLTTALVTKGNQSTTPPKRRCKTLVAIVDVKPSC